MLKDMSIAADLECDQHFVLSHITLILDGMAVAGSHNAASGNKKQEREVLITCLPDELKF